MKYQRNLMTCIAVPQMAGGEVEHANEHCDKDVEFVVAASRLIELAHDVGWIALAQCNVVEKRLRDGHDES